MSFQKGGQRRTIETGCGWTCRKSPREADALFRMHRRHCELCKGSGDLPEFNRVNGKANGWGGVGNNFKVQQGYTSEFRTITEDGEVASGLIKTDTPNMPTIEELLPALDGLPLIVEEKKPKKNNKKKSKK
jgi:hypothetical protein